MILREGDEHEAHAGCFLPGSVVDVLAFDDLLVGAGQRPVGFDISHRCLIGAAQEVPIRYIQINSVGAAPAIEPVDLFPLLPLRVEISFMTAM